MTIRVTVNAIIPEYILNVPEVRADIVKALRNKTTPEVRRLFKQTTQGWKHKPGFSSTFSNSATRISAKTFPTGKYAEQYGYVDLGTRAHTIRARNAPTLRFRRNYRPSTRPRILKSSASYRSGPIMTPVSVRHPGSEAREFSETIADAIADQFQKDVQDAI